MRHDFLQRRLAGVGVKPKTAMGDAAGAFDVEFASIPRCVMCQSFATPSSALYWHIGETTMRLARLRSASRNGEKSALVMPCHIGGNCFSAMAQ
jgi:hypothetical protein